MESRQGGLCVRKKGHSLTSFLSGIHLGHAFINESALGEGRKFYRKVKGRCCREIARKRSEGAATSISGSRDSQSLRRAVMVYCAVEKGAGSLWVRHTVL